LNHSSNVSHFVKAIDAQSINSSVASSDVFAGISTTSDTLADFYAFFHENEALRAVVEYEVNKAADSVLHNSFGILVQACIASNILKQVRLYQTNIPALMNITEDKVSWAIDMTIHDRSMNSLDDFYALFHCDEELRDVIKDKVNHTAKLIKHNRFNLTSLGQSSAILELVRAYQVKYPTAANVRVLNIISTNDISRVIDMAVAVHDRPVKPLIAFYALFDGNEALHTVVKEDVNQAADLLQTYKSGGFTTFGHQTALVSKLLSKVRLYQQTHPNVPNNPALNNITADDISLAIDMTMHDRSVYSLIDFYAQFGENEELRTMAKKWFQG
jgi:hypothetical protein